MQAQGSKNIKLTPPHVVFHEYEQKDTDYKTLYFVTNIYYFQESLGSRFPDEQLPWIEVSHNEEGELDDEGSGIYTLGLAKEEAHRKMIDQAMDHFKKSEYERYYFVNETGVPRIIKEGTQHVLT